MRVRAGSGPGSICSDTAHWYVALEMHSPRTILLLDDDEDMRVTIGEAVRRTGLGELVAAADVASLIDLGQRALDCDVALLDVNLGPGKPSGIDAYTWLVEHGFAGRIVFLTGHARNHPLVQQARRHDSVQVMQKPIGLRAIRDLVEEDARG